MHNNAGFGTYLYSVSIHHGNLLKLLLTTRRVTFNSVGPQETGFREEEKKKEKKRREKKREGEWTRKVVISTRKKFLAVGEACMAIF